MPAKSRFSKIAGTRSVFALVFVSALMVLVVSVVEKIIMNRNITLLMEVSQNHLLAAAQAAARFAVVEELDRYHTIEDTQNPEYQKLKRRLDGFAKDYNVLFVYYWRDYGGGQGQFIVDNDADPDTMVGPWSVFEIEENAKKALSGEPCVTGSGANTPSWRRLVTAAIPMLDTATAPVFNSAGSIYCVAGVDIDNGIFFSQHRNARYLLITQIVAFVIAVIFGALSVRLYRNMTKQNNDTHEKLQFFSDNLRRLFSPYLSDSAIEEIAANPARLQLNGARRYMTAMFTGVKDFLNIAESMQPENLVNLLNIYLSTMSDAILEQKGMIDKYEGGSIIAFFGAPLEERGHALRACASALFIKRLEKEINHKTRKMPLFTRAGIITGNMVVGNMGSEHKKNYTITGKSVHLAARLESMNKQYGTWILITETTFQETGGRVFARRLDRVRMAGIDEPVRIYELLEFSDMVTDTMREWVSVFHEGLAQFEARNWRGAAKLFIRVLKLNPSDRPARLFYERAVRYVKTPPAVNWDGVFSVSQ